MKTMHWILIVTVAAAQASCQKSPKQDDYDDENKGTTIVSGAGVSSSSNRSKFTIPLSVNYGALSLLGTPATAYSVDLDGCLSGYTATVTEANVDGVEVYKDDRDCLAKLTSFTVGGITYTNTDTGAVDFTTWLANDSATFASAGGDLISVKVISQLDSPISGTEAIVYNFSELLDGTSDHTFAEADVSAAHLITVESQEAPLFSIVGATYIGMDDTTGAAEFTFKLECVDDPTAGSPTSTGMADGSGTNTLCSDNDLADITYKLVKDTYGSTLEISDANTIFGTAGQSISIPADQYADSATEEGFNTVTLDGPGPLGTAGNENMILILKAGISYTYFNVDVTTITQ